MAQSACNLISRFVIRFWLIHIYISFWYLWQLARDQRTACTWQSFARESSFFSCNQYWRSSERMDFQLATQRWIMHSLPPSSKWVSLVRPRIGTLVIDDVLSKFILTTYHVSRQLIDCSFIIPKPPALNDIIQFPPGQFLADIDQSVSSPWSFLIALSITYTGLVC